MFSSTATDRDFTKNFLISLVGHGLVVALSFLGGQLLMNVFKNNDVEIIRSSIRVDVVGMPKFTVQELKQIQKDESLQAPAVEVKGEKVETKVETEDVIKKDDIVIQEEGKKKNASFMNMISDYSSKKVAPKVAKKGENTGTKQDLSSLVIEGNRLSKGSALVGDFSDENASEFAAYVQTIPEIVRQFWNLPSYLKEKNLRCRVRIFISANGEVIKLEMHESSGESEFDVRAEKAIRDAAPFPKPSEVAAKRLTNSGIILGFPL